MYVGLEVCGADEARLEATKARFADLAAKQQGISKADFDAAFESRLPEVRSSVQAEGNTMPEAQKEQACQNMLRKL